MCIFKLVEVEETEVESTVDKENNAGPGEFAIMDSLTGGPVGASDIKAEQIESREEGGDNNTRGSN